jgi:hypothetical protein
MTWLRRLFHRHTPDYYTDHLTYSRAVCRCGWEGPVAPDGRFY